VTSSSPTTARASRKPSSDPPSNGSIAGIHTLSTPIGTLLLERNADGLAAVRFGGEAAVGDGPAVSADPVLLDAADQLRAYFAGELREFQIRLAPRGTAFQQDVWAAVSAIPYGSTATYSEMAAAVGRPSACRAVGAANGRNPLPVIVPCHRVVGAAGELTGYGGGLDRKRALLDLEAAAG
jgi:methylated-DNA-[protein]-cysteine S-methyltransferase